MIRHIVFFSVRRKEDVEAVRSGLLALGKIPPFGRGLIGILAEDIVDDDIGPPGLVEAGDDIRTDKASPAGNQDHMAVNVAQWSSR